MSHRQNRILAVAPVHRGFGLVILDAADALLDWRVKEIREKAQHKNARCQFEVDKLMEQYRPAVLVIEDHKAPGSKKRERTKALLDLLADHAKQSGVGVAKYGPHDIRLSLGLEEASNKVELAKEVAKRLPALKPKTPTEKRIWQQENYSMPIFVAAALALSHLARR